jgi:uncharacterized protein with NAD-binding domain and iron-sulfur cluster
MNPVSKSPKVAILGGGIAGITAAHELIERDFDVVVYDAKPVPGGKARTIPVPGSAVDGRKPLPGEHGFRFFPGFYRHLPDSFARIPTDSGSLLDRLVAGTHTLVARAGERGIVFPSQCPATVGDLLDEFRSFDKLGIPQRDLSFFAQRLLLLLTSCDERRFAEYENVAWWDFVQADKRSPAFRKFLADGVTRKLVACRAKIMSARTGGCILLQFLFDLAEPGAQTDRVLDGPTTEIWLDPWLAYLQSKGVTYRTGSRITEIICSDRQIKGVRIDTGSGSTVETADYYVAALPVEQLLPLLTDALKEAEPRLAKLDQLLTAWMNGIQFFLKNDLPLVKGHVLFIDSEWSLTAISQKQFWPAPMDEYGDGTVGGVLSVDISDWESPGIGGKTAQQCESAEEIKDEVVAQLQRHLNVDGQVVFDENNIVRWFLDPDIVMPNLPKAIANLEPLLINTAGSWANRPEAVTSIPNLFIASDYVRTHTDLATMESANEAARRAVNGILAAAGSSARRCAVWPLSEPWVFAPLCAWDRWRFRRGRPNIFDEGQPPGLCVRAAVHGTLWLWRCTRWFWQALRWGKNRWRGLRSS